jgi:hypothetical protein
MKTPEEVELDAKKSELSDLETKLVDRELDLVSETAAVRAFESVYINRVGVIYAELDEVNSEIAAILAERSPKEPQFLRNAQEAADRARASRSEVDQSTHNPIPSVERSDDLVKLYRKAARTLHPDLATDESEKDRRRMAMATVNQAYEKGDFAAIQKALEDWEASPESVPGDGIVAELIRVIRRLSQVRTRLLEIEKTIDALRLTDIFVLFKQHEESKSRGEDLLDSLVSQASREVSDAKKTLKKLKKEASKK